jgi:L-lactate dehydrogenase
MKTNTIGIIGMGWVGTSIAISTLHEGICRSLLLNDIREGIAEGEAMDLNQGSFFFPSSEVRAAAVEDMLDCDAIVITAGRGGKPNESRLDLLKSNIDIARNLSEQLRGYQGMLVVVANPVDVLTYFYQQFTGLPAHRVIGTGTLLDTTRLRSMIGTKLNLEPQSIHAQVVGEHGDSEVVLWSRAMIGGIRLREWKGWSPDFESEIGEEVRTAAYEIIRRKGATNHAIGLVTANLLKWLLRGERRIVSISTVMSGPYGLHDVALSLPTLMSAEGATEVLEVDMDDSELKRFLHSAEVLKAAIQSVR